MEKLENLKKKKDIEKPINIQKLFGKSVISDFFAIESHTHSYSGLCQRADYYKKKLNASKNGLIKQQPFV